MTLSSFKLITFPLLFSYLMFSLFSFLKFLHLRLSLQPLKPLLQFAPISTPNLSTIHFWYSNLPSLYLSNMVSFAKTWDPSSDSSFSTSTSLFSMSSEMVKLLKTHYVDRAYLLTSLTISHLEEEENGDNVMSFDPPFPMEAS